ncbi:MAG: dienelactone hydrolase family protein [Candidatus Omnitrophica bacterium]|nr:dienelactone hydrolase family protein [Candidatus Omnitrophota bacterium]
MKRLLLCAAIILAWCGFGMAAQLQETTVRYQAGDTVLQGYLVYDAAVPGKRPGVLVVHEWWGVTDYVRQRARMLAELGYTALAIDMYGEGKQAADPTEAAAFSQALRQDAAAANQRFQAAEALLGQQDTVERGKIAAIGYCFGGTIVLEMARRGEPLAGVVSFHGNLATAQPAQAGQVAAKILVCHGDADNLVPAEQLEQFHREMAQAGVDAVVKIYADATHAFTNPQADDYARKFNLPIAYNEAADRQSWQDMQDFFLSIGMAPARGLQ